MIMLKKLYLGYNCRKISTTFRCINQNRKIETKPYKLLKQFFYYFLTKSLIKYNDNP